MISIKTDRHKKNPVSIELNAENMDELKNDILSIAKNLVEAMAKSTDNSAESLARALTAQKMLELGAKYALDAITKN